VRVPPVRREAAVTHEVSVDDLPADGGPTSVSPPGLTATVVVCAYTLDRWEDVQAAVGSVLAQRPSAGQVLVVIDHHDELLRRARETWASEAVTVLANTRSPGLSGARNTALGQASGEVVVFLDDDAVPVEGWLAQLLAPYRDPRVAGVGGWTEQVWPDGAGRPAHLAPELDWVVGCSYRGLPVEQADVRNLMGCNMSFRRRALDGLEGFREDAGRIGSIPLGCEETELCIRLTQRDPAARLLMTPTARVLHRVTAERATWAYLRRRAWAEGLSKAAMIHVVGSRTGLSSERDYLRSVLPAAVVREVSRAVRGRREGVAGALGVITATAAAGAGYAHARWRGSRRGADPALLARERGVR
jgi:cellulose synthase/poly-beta-1,6-N-acetylglucosamine synthase-like glycosyltransferase